MTAFLAGVRGTVVPDARGRHGPLPPVLLSMTVVTGLVDAVSYLTLGHVFAANMTGNVAFLSFALAGALAGAAMVLHARIWCPLLIALVLVLAGAVATYWPGRDRPGWITPAAAR